MYASELRRLAKNCQFGDQLNIALRDQFVCGLLQEGIQRKLLAKLELTLKKALQIARANEIAQYETKTLKGGMRHHASKQATETTFAVNKPATAGRRKSRDTLLSKTCYRCNESGHKTSNCKFKNHTCHYCKSRGHLIKACRKKGAHDRVSAPTGGKAKPTYEILEEEMSVNGSVSRKDGVKITVNVADVNFQMELDTGATVTVIPSDLYKRQLSDVKLQPAQLSYKHIMEKG